MAGQVQLESEPGRPRRPSGRSVALSLAAAAILAWLALRQEEKTWTFAYYDNRALEGQATSGELASADIDMEDPALGAVLEDDQFSLRLESCLRVPVAGRYQFRLSADNGARLFLKDEVAVDAWKLGQPATGKVLALAPGSYPIRVEYYDSGGPARLRVEMSQPGVHTFRSLRGRTERPLSNGACAAL